MVQQYGTDNKQSVVQQYHMMHADDHDRCGCVQLIFHSLPPSTVAHPEETPVHDLETQLDAFHQQVKVNEPHPQD